MMRRYKIKRGAAAPLTLGRGTASGSAFRLLAVLAVLLLATGAKASSQAENVEVRLRAGYSLGASTPLGLPATIRKLNSFRLSPNFVLGADVTLPLAARWGLQTGLRFENKGLDATVTTKGYHMAMVKGGEELEGVYTGRVEQHVKAWMVTVPVQATYALAGQWRLRMGPYISLLMAKTFSGNVSDGYLRKDTPTGQKIEMGHEPDEQATYDFSSDMRRLQAGMGLGADWQLSQRVGLSADLTWGLTGLMRSSFKTVEQTLYPIYGTLSVSYKLGRNK